MIEKRLKLILLCVFFCGVLISCGQKPDEISETTIIDQSTREETEQITEEHSELTEEESKTDISEERELTMEEMIFFTGYLSQLDHYGFLMSEYETPVEVDLSEVFYSGAGIEMEELTEEEIQAYFNATGHDEIYTDIVHLSSTQIDEFLYDKTGFFYNEMENPLLWVYIEEYDTYCHEAGDTNYMSFLCEGGSVVDETYYILYVEAVDEYETYQNGSCELVMEKSGDGYRFVSNRFLSNNFFFE